MSTEPLTDFDIRLLDGKEPGAPVVGDAAARILLGTRIQELEDGETTNTAAIAAAQADATQAIADAAAAQADATQALADAAAAQADATQALADAAAAQADADTANAALALVYRGVAVVLNGQASVVVVLPASATGKPAQATMNEADGAVHVLSAVVAGTNLTITLSANTTDDRNVGYSVDAR